VAAVVTVLSIVGVPAAHADACNNGAVKPGASSSGWYECQGGAWQYHPPPTFDPLDWIEVAIVTRGRGRVGVMRRRGVSRDLQIISG
jgi:hypothetical protein